MVYNNLLSGGDVLQDTGRVAHAAVHSLIMRSLNPETQQPCAVTGKAAVRAVHKLRIGECSRCKPFFSFSLRLRWGTG